MKATLPFFFIAEKRVDFRELVKELSRNLRTHVELRQIGARDEAKYIGGLGKCGLPLCCITILTEFNPVSIRMAKEQKLEVNGTLKKDGKTKRGKQRLSVFGDGLSGSLYFEKDIELPHIIVLELEK